MKTRYLALFVLLVLVGCGGTSSSMNPPTLTPLPFSWTGNGNPLASICPSGVTNNCVSTIDIQDITTSVITSIPAAQTSYSAANNTDKYQIRTSGYDANGVALHSAWEAVN